MLLHTNRHRIIFRIKIVVQIDVLSAKIGGLHFMGKVKQFISHCALNIQISYSNLLFTWTTKWRFAQCLKNHNRVACLTWVRYPTGGAPCSVRKVLVYVKLYVRRLINSRLLKAGLHYLLVLRKSSSSSLRISLKFYMIHVVLNNF